MKTLTDDVDDQAPEDPTLERLLRACARPQRRRVLTAWVLAAATAAAGVGLLGLSGWFLAAAAVAGTAGPGLAIAFNTPLPSAFIRLLAMVRTAGRYGERMAGHDAAFRSLARLRPAVFARLAAAPPGWALGWDAGDAAGRLVEDVGEIEHHLIRRIGRSAASGAVLAGGAALLIAGGPRLAGAIAALLAIETVLATWLARSQAARHHELPASLGALRGAVLRAHAARFELRAHGLEDRAQDEIMRHADALTALQRRIGAAGGWFVALHATGAGLAALIALALSSGTGVAHAALAALAAFATGEAAGASLLGLERRGPLRAARQRLDDLMRRGSRTPAPRIHPAATLTLDGMRLAPGRIVALQGPSGSGKTTLLETLVRLREPVAGRVQIGASDLADLPVEDVRGLFSLAAQHAPILLGTVRDNLLIAFPLADDDTLFDALATVALDDRIRSMRDGLDSWLGEGGIRLSGGEARRLCLARALLRPAPWLLLDEPTEGLDVLTEASVVAGLRAHLMTTGQGALIVSHRAPLTTLCDTTLTIAS